MDNQTYFDATLVCRFKDVTEEVTIHRPKCFDTAFCIILHQRILNCHSVKVAQKPLQTLGHIFAKPKDPVTKEQRTDAIYSIP